jgi:hypothetical protein
MHPSGTAPVSAFFQVKIDKKVKVGDFTDESDADGVEG